MKYYVDDPEQTEEVQKKLEAIKYRNVNPEEIRVIEPCCGSGHILVYVFDLLYKMYEEKGYPSREIPSLILKNNIVGLDVDKRAAQLASFSLVMKARSVNPRFFNDNYYTEPQVYEIHDSQYLERIGYKQHMKNIGVFTDEEIKAVETLVELFRHGKTIGSLIKMKPIKYECVESVIYKLEHEVVASVFDMMFSKEGCELLKKLLTQAKVLSIRYDVMITNPPYVNINKMEQEVKDYARINYPNSKSDMFSMFIELSFDFVNQNGFSAFMTPYVWMFIKSYENIRYKIIIDKQIETLSQLEYSALEEAIVPLCTFVLRNIKPYRKGIYFRLTDFRGGMTIQNNMFLYANQNSNCNYKYTTDAENFLKVPGNPIAYWWKNFTIFDSPTIAKYYESAGRNKTHNNELYVRNWWEIKDCNRWQPYANGGDFRRWAGNDLDYVDWSEKAKHIYALNGGLYNQKYAGKQGICWNLITSYKNGFRIKKASHHYSSAAPTIIKNTDTDIDRYVLAYLNSCVGEALLKIYNPTLNTTVGDVLALPLIIQNQSDVTKICFDCCEISQQDWDDFETSWDFKYHPLIQKKALLADAFTTWESKCRKRFDTLKANEEELNRIFIEIYGLQDELTPEVEDKDVTVRLSDEERDIKSLISYLIGVIMGRYSLDVPGLAYAGGEWDASKYRTYQPDDDGIVPIYSKLGMEDGLTARIIGLIKQIYGEDTYRQNIDFIAEVLGKNNNESSEETLNRYLNDGFYADHLKTYKKRPIYWMFSSGKHGGFKCLIYMHRYTEYTLALINSKYFLPESTRLKNDIEELLSRISTAEGRDKIRLEKELQKLTAAYNEAIEYGQVLDHMANKYIAIDLDDGVKVNYAKFQGVEIVTDGGTKVKKDLLVPIK